MAANPTTLADLRSSQLAKVPTQTTAVVTAGFFDLQGFELLQRVAKAFASSTLVPQQYQNNVANCMIALNLARRLHADELMVMQNLYIVHGNPGWSAKFLIACVNTCGRFSALRYEWRGKENADDFGCRAWAVERETGERLNGAWVDWKMVKAEGWSTKSGSKWKTMPEQMFIYRSAAFWQRGYAPEISMGLSTAEELHDVVDVRSDGSFTISSEELRAGMKDVPTGKAAEVVDQSTGEIMDAQSKDAGAPAVGKASLIEKLKASKSIDELNGHATLIQTLPLPDGKEAKLVYLEILANLEAAQ